jgi:RNA polymerase sigma-70 factor (ECF subfamily)
LAEPKTSYEAVQETEIHGDAEAVLVAALLNRNRKAAAEFVSLYSDSVHAYVYRRLMPRADLVDDLVQDVFLSAWDGLLKFEGRSSLKTWLLGIARHKVEDYYRTQLREMPLDDGEDALLDVADDPQMDLAVDRTRAMLRTQSVLEELPEPSRLLLLWRYWEKRSLREIAETIGKSEKAVERALARARQQFRRRWERGKR